MKAKKATMSKAGRHKEDKDKHKDKHKDKRHFKRSIITIEVDNCECIFIPDPPTISKKNGDEVLWHSADDRQYHIRFSDSNQPRPSPFDSTDFDVKANGSTPSGKVTLPDPIPSGGYDFSYTVTGVPPCDGDPMIHVSP